MVILPAAKAGAAESAVPARAKATKADASPLLNVVIYLFLFRCFAIVSRFMFRVASGAFGDEMARIDFLMGKDGRLVADATDGVRNFALDHRRVARRRRIGNRNGGEKAAGIVMARVFEDLLARAHFHD